MNRTELAAVVALFVLLLSWGFVQRQLAPAPAPELPGLSTSAVSGDTNGPTAVAEAVVPPDAGTPAELPAADSGVAETPRLDAAREAAPAGGEPAEHAAPEETVVLSNDVVQVGVSSWGGVIPSVRLTQYPETLDPDSGPVHFDFSTHPALSIEGIPGLSVGRDFTLSPASDGTAVTISRVTPGGLGFERLIRIESGYRLVVTDTFRNGGTAALDLPEHGVSIGPMRTSANETKTRGMTYLGVDTLASHGGARIMYWAKKRLPALFGYRTVPLSCARPDTSAMPIEVRHRVGEPLTWISAKNKFFVQLLAPETESADGELRAERLDEAGSFEIATLWGSLVFSGRSLSPGESYTREMSYYVGPKEYSRLKALGKHQGDIMDFGWFGWLCKPLLYVLNRIHSLLPGGYGVAIILLTVLVRLVFWPVTHKSTESMKKMQKLQPLVNEIRAKYKSNPQKMNQEVMALYKEHKANPMGGCLPMLIQIPVFIALFNVLRSAVELRFASFLWIRDLSEPENLLAGVIPVVGALNILPLVMTATMVWQQKLTPTAGDPQQQKMMMYMPVVMLFIFYSMPSALVLYWSVSQCLSIVQLLRQNRKTAREQTAQVQTPKKLEAAKGGGRGKRK